MTGVVASGPSSQAEAWLDCIQAAALLGLSAPRLAGLLEDGVLPVHAAPSGARGVLKSELLAWQLRDQAARREALAAFTAAIDREVFR